ncbi:MAG: ABC transporter ATP-binding protein, partial [Rhodobacterales bacterium]
RVEKGLTYVLVSHDLAVVSHMCERLMVMQHGARVEELTRRALQNRAATQVYTRQLLVASEGFKSQ